jgi:hypothetical protein
LTPASGSLECAALPAKISRFAQGALVPDGRLEVGRLAHDGPVGERLRRREVLGPGAPGFLVHDPCKYDLADETAPLPREFGGDSAGREHRDEGALRIAGASPEESTFLDRR